MKKKLLKLIPVVAVIFLGYIIYNNIQQPKEMLYYSPSYTKFVQNVKANQILKVKIEPINTAINELVVLDKQGDEYTLNVPATDTFLINDLLNNHVDVRINSPAHKSFLMELLFQLFPAILIVSVMIYFYSKQNGNRFGFGKPAARLLEKDENNQIKFDDVAGCENEKRELYEVVEFLKNPEKFNRLGGKIPRGILLTGPSGTGKTLLAKATANESGVPFYYCSGSSFVEIYVGQGAAKVRDMFAQLRKHEKCVLFIDECDSISKQRSSGINSNDERDSTLNALLTEMDGIDPRSGIIIIAATNLPDVIDTAFLRPGRFDRQIGVGLPDVNGRHRILEIHTKNVPLHKDIDLLELAKRTTGFSGAELQNLVNEAAIFASREDAECVDMEHFDKSLDKILMGTEKSATLMSSEEKLQTAYHEVGHFFVAQMSDVHDKAYKMSIRPRANSLGVTIFVPSKDSVSASKKKLESQIATLLAGRIAEELYMGTENVTTGCSQDYIRATDIATKMVCEWGMSSLPPMVYVEADPFSGKPKLKNMPEKTQIEIQHQIEQLMTTNYKNAKSLLRNNWKKVVQIAELLNEKEDLDVKEIQHILDKR